MSNMYFNVWSVKLNEQSVKYTLLNWQEGKRYNSFSIVNMNWWLTFEVHITRTYRDIKILNIGL